MPLEVDADLTLEIDGVGATLRGHGQDIVLESADPAALLASLSYAALPVAVGRIDGPRSLGRVADLLNDEGLQLTVTGPAGPVLAMGRGARSSFGRIVTGSAFVRPGAVSVVRPLVLAEGRRRAAVVVRGRVGAVAGGSAVALVALWVARRVRRSTGS